MSAAPPHVYPETEYVPPCERPVAFGQNHPRYPSGWCVACGAAPEEGCVREEQVMVWTSANGPKCPVSPADRGEFMKPAPALFEIRETKKYSFDVIDRRLAGPGVWIASFRMFKDAAEYTAGKMALAHTRPEGKAAAS